MLPNEVKFSSFDYWVATCTSFQICIQVYHVKSVRNTGLWYLQKLVRFVVKARVALERTKIFSFFFISNNCGIQFCCEPMFCVESVMDHSLLYGMMLALWHSCLSFSRPLYLLYLTVFINKNILCLFCSVVFCVFITFNNIGVIAYMHCTSEIELTYCVKCGFRF
jgi:hypothetical protein